MGGGRAVWQAPPMPLVPIPPDLVWDHHDPPADELWRLQRIAEWFPHRGRDRATVERLHARRSELQVPIEIVRLIELYEADWQERETGAR